MNCMKKLYGKAVIDNSDSDELPEDCKIELEYYQVENHTSNKPYGIEIVKKNIQNAQMNIENKIMNHISENEKDTNDIIELFISNKVTPIAAEDILQDLIKTV